MSVLIAILALMVVTGIYREGRDFYLSRHKPKAVESKKQRTEFDCTAYVARIFDQRLIDAGIETTLTKCADTECPTCHPKAVERPKPPKGKGGGSPIIYPAVETKHCKTCSSVISDHKRDECDPCVKNRHEYIKKNKEPRRKVVEHNGQYYSVYLPTEVPDYAHVEIADRDFMGFPTAPPFAQAHLKWTDPKTGQTKGLRATATQVEKYEVHVDQYSKQVNEFYDAGYVDYNAAINHYNARLDVLDKAIETKYEEIKNHKLKLRRVP